jgi:hypothetical protein
MVKLELPIAEFEVSSTYSPDDAMNEEELATAFSSSCSMFLVLVIGKS